MNRRDLFKTALVVSGGLAASMLVNGSADAAQCPEGIIYTAGNEGMWKGKAAGHAPVIALNGNAVTVTTKHVMTEKHFIVRHVILSSDGRTLGSKTFTPSDKEAVSNYELPAGYKGKLFATSFCNQHDLWLSEATV